MWRGIQWVVHGQCAHCTFPDMKGLEELFVETNLDLSSPVGQ